MKVNMKKYFLLNLLCLVFGISSCNGVIEDGTLGSNTKVKDGDTLIDYDGIVEARAISDNKVEIYFLPHDDETDSTVYQISYQGIDAPITVPLEVIQKDYRGFYYYIVDGLDLGTIYYFTVQVKDIDTSKISNNFTNLQETTFFNKTADFSGVTLVEPSPGINALTSIQVFWVPGTKLGSLVSPHEIDPVGYEVIVLQSGSSISPEDFDNETLADEFRRVFLVSPDTSFLTVDSLKEDTSYFVRVRAVHQGFNDNPNDASYKVEVNNRYIEYKTPSSADDSLVFQSDSLSLSVPGDFSGYYTINVSWSFPIGVFDHYRIYYSKNPAAALNGFPAADVCNEEEDFDPTIFCKKSHYSNVSDVLAGLSPYENYKVLLKVCQDTTCSVSRSSDIKDAATIPGLIDFGGITTMDNPENPDRLDQIMVHLAPLDYSTGVLDGLIVYYEANPNDFVALNHPTIDPPTSGPYINQFNYQQDASVKIRGLEAGIGKEYCFQVLPFLYDEDSNVQVANTGIKKCITPELIAPNAADFLGPNDCLNTGVDFITVRWSEPLGGLYSHFDVIIRPRDAAEEFDYVSAQTDSTTYTTYNIERFNRDFSITGLNSESQYQVGVRTYFYDGADILRNVLSSQTRFLNCNTTD